MNETIKCPINSYGIPAYLFLPLSTGCEMALGTNAKYTCSVPIRLDMPFELEHINMFIPVDMNFNQTTYIHVYVRMCV